MKKAQLDLFTAETIAFPVDRRQREIREAAETLNRIHGHEAARYWKALCRSIADPLRDAGIPEPEVRRQMFAFQGAVQADLWALEPSRSSGQ